MADFKRTLITAALPYANGPLHIGHLAGAYLPADLYARYLRLKGEDVVFICGSDEMGVAIVMKARAEGVSPQDIVDRYHPIIRDSFAAFGIAFDHYDRTTSKTHRETAQAFFEHMDAQGLLSTKEEEQLFDPVAGLFLADRFVKGTCPDCGYEDAYGDQCEKCGRTLSPAELINPRSTLTDATPEMRPSTHWYLPLGDMQGRLESFITSRSNWKPNVLGQVRSWLNDGLRDRAVTRDVPWGVPVPASVAERHGVNVDGKVIYVWFDAPIGYISATRAWAAGQGEPERWKKYWQEASSRLIHFIGKDNIVFHCLMFPAMLDAHGDFVLPDQVPANEFLNLEGQKLSTSRGWAVWLHEYLDAFPPDLLRYALAATLPETKDADFSWDDFQARANGELADVLGNFVNRTITFAHRFAGSAVPPLVNPSETDRAVMEQLAQFPARIGGAYDQFRIREAVFETMQLARLGNKYFNDTEPWKTRASDPQACANTIHVSLQLCATLSILADPVIPFAAEQLQGMLNLTGVRRSVPSGDAQGLSWMDAGGALLEVGHGIGEAVILFTKVADEQISAQRAKLEDSGRPVAESEEPAEAPYAPVAPEMVFDDFTKMDLRVGEIVLAEPVPKADKLLRLVVNLGFEERQILSGIAAFFDPQEIVGKRVVVVANLAPRKMRGLLSEGMILMAEDRQGQLSFVESDGEPGSVVR